MTCIVGVVEKGKVYIGGDSAGVTSSDWSLHVRSDKKVFTKNKMVFGFTTSFRMGQLLRHSLTVPKRHPDDDLECYMATTFINAVRQCLKDGGYAGKTSETERGGTFLVGYDGRLFTVHDDYQVAECSNGFSAVGCGASIAMGALYAADKLKPKDRVTCALKAAEAFSAGVRGPFSIVTTKDATCSKS